MNSPVASTPVPGSLWSAFATTAGVEIAHVDLRPDTFREAEAYAWLDDPERASWRRYLPGPRRRFSLCRAALRAFLCSRIGCSNDELSFGTSRHGKPFAVVRGTPSPFSFNLSHAGDHGLIALAPGGRIGVDVEERVDRRNLDELIDAVMGPDEKAELAALEGVFRVRLFYRIWTCKEALVKALGTGFSTDVSRFQVPFNLRQGDTAGTFRFPHLPAVAWGLRDVGSDAFAAALAYELPAGGPPPAAQASPDD